MKKTLTVAVGLLCLVEVGCYPGIYQYSYRCNDCHGAYTPSPPAYSGHQTAPPEAGHPVLDNHPDEPEPEPEPEPDDDDDEPEPEDEIEPPGVETRERPKGEER